MAIRDTGTEQLIKDTAKRIFFAEGKFNATTQDIADAAGVARTVINYYFRSKDVLFQLVFKEALEGTRNKMDEVLTSSLPFKKKVIKFIDVFSADLAEYPFKESFLITEINRHGFILPMKEPSLILQQFFNETQEAMDKGEVKKMLPINFLINLFSLMSYP
jgi:TetR/AcrR family transcriptional regulator